MMLKALMAILAGLSWHIWRVLICRPSLASLGDTRFNFVFISVMFFVLGAARHSVKFTFAEGAYSFLMIVGALALMYFILAAFFLRSDRSKVLFMGILLCSISVDVVGLIVNILGGNDLLSSVLTIYEIALYFVVIKAFNGLPDAAKRPGFRPKLTH